MKGQPESQEFSLPVHLDFTSVCGAALAVEESEIRDGRLPFSRLMSLSQLVEAIVIHDQLQFELGTTPDWARFRDFVEQSNFLRRCDELDVPLHVCEAQVDQDDASILNAAEWAVDQAHRIPLGPLEWAVRFRAGTYDAVSNVADAKNRTLGRYLSTIREHGGGSLWQRVSDFQTRLDDNHVGPLGLFVLMRLSLIRQYLASDVGLANYVPHFSRQPLIVVSNDSTFELKRWSIDRIRDRRLELLAGNEPPDGGDTLSTALSPIFLHCIEQANRPEDILEAALSLRNSDGARTYRAECREVFAKVFDGSGGASQEFKLRIRRAIEGLAVTLPGDDVRVERKVTVGASASIMGIGLTSIVLERSSTVKTCLGCRSASFLNDVLGHAMGVVRAQERLSEIYGLNLQYDSDVISWQPKQRAGGAQM